MIFLEHARNDSTERRLEPGTFPVGTVADAQRRRNAAPLRRRENMMLPLKDTHATTAKSYLWEDVAGAREATTEEAPGKPVVKPAY